MRPPTKLLPFLIGLLALALAACSMPGSQSSTTGPSVQDAAATMVAATFQALTAQAPATPLVAPLPQATSAGKPSLFINMDNATCRAGPGPDFKVIANLPAGTSVELAGQDTADSYWIALDPISHSQCWISVMDATPSGDYQALPQMKPPAVTVTVPGKPTRGSWNFACDNTTLTTILGWNPPSGQVNGYRIYRKGSQIADVPFTQTSYTDKVPFTYGSNMDYEVAAYNEAGVSQQATWNFHCP